MCFQNGSETPFNTLRVPQGKTFAVTLCKGDCVMQFDDLSEVDFSVVSESSVLVDSDAISRSGRDAVVRIPIRTEVAGVATPEKKSELASYYQGTHGD